MNHSQFDEKTFARSLDQNVDQHYDYLLEWLFEQPIATSLETVTELKKVGLVLNKFIKYFGQNFVEHALYERMPVSEKVKKIITIFNQKDCYDVGTYRTDFVFDKALKPKFIEITCQFSLNAFFQAAIYNRYSKEFSSRNGLDDYRVDDYEPFISFIVSKIGASRSVCVIKGRDKIQASRFFTPVLQNAGLDVKEISYKAVWENKSFLENSLVISEIMMDEIESLSDEEIELLANCNLVNDFRTIFIAHDKRFFALLNDPELQANILREDEIQLLNKYLIKTHRCDSSAFDVEAVIANKDAWVLKHISLGRSREIYAGLEFSQDDWEKQLNSIDRTNFVLQEWVPQRRFSGTVNGVKHNDYLTGTLLYFDTSYFGLGLFRSSSHIIANKVDNRNIFPLVVQQKEELDNIDTILSF